MVGSLLPRDDDLEVPEGVGLVAEEAPRSRIFAASFDSQSIADVSFMTLS